jgi:hypothetical protein
MNLATIDHEVDTFEDLMAARGGTEVLDLEKRSDVGHNPMLFPLRR